VIAMLFVLLVCVGNFAIGFALAVHLGHGPAWALPRSEQVRDRLRSLLRLGGNDHRSAH
jgi:hypothetical protein